MQHSVLTPCSNGSWAPVDPGSSEELRDANLVLVFGGRTLFDQSSFDSLRAMFPDAEIVSTSTSGDIHNDAVSDEKLVACAIRFEATGVSSCEIAIDAFEDSFDAGKKLANGLAGEELCHVLVLSDGQIVNGAQLVRGINEVLGKSVSVSGGLAGDGTLFQETLVGLNGVPSSGNIVGIGFYGTRLHVRNGVGSGWHPFGPERVVTKSQGNVLWEIDGENALGIYKRYLGEQAAGLPASALKFPLSLKVDGREEAVVRTILSIDEEKQNMTFAGEMPEGATVQLMRGYLDGLVEGAREAADAAKFEDGTPDLTLCVSCVGRRIVFGQRVEEELESVQSVLGDSTIIGLYSYGEIGAGSSESASQLHNQSICVTTFKEDGQA